MLTLCALVALTQDYGFGRPATEAWASQVAQRVAVAAAQGESGSIVGPWHPSEHWSVTAEDGFMFLSGVNGLLFVRQSDGRAISYIGHWRGLAETAGPTPTLSRESVAKVVERALRAGGWDVEAKVVVLEKPPGGAEEFRTVRFEVSSQGVPYGVHPIGLAEMHVGTGRLTSITFPEVLREPTEWTVGVTERQARRVVIGELLRRGLEDFTLTTEPRLMIAALNWDGMPKTNEEFRLLAREQTPPTILAYCAVAKSPSAEDSFFYIYVCADDGKLLRVNEQVWPTAKPPSRRGRAAGR